MTGIFHSQYDFQMNSKHGFPIFKTFIECNNLKEVKQAELSEITQQDIHAITELAKDPFVFQRIFSSVAPSIYGHENIKKSIALCLFGGVPVHKEAHTI